MKTMDFEKWLGDELKKQAHSLKPPAHLKERIGANIKQASSRNFNTLLKGLHAALVVLMILAIGLFGQKAILPLLQEKKSQSEAAQQVSKLLEDMIGTKEEAQSKWNITPEGYAERRNELEAAHKFLSETEFADYVELKKQYIDILQKAKKDDAALRFDEDLLDKQDAARIQVLNRKAAQYQQKIRSHFQYTKEDAVRMMGFSIHYPRYVPDGYRLAEEHVEPEITLTNPKPIVEMSYRKGAFGFTVYQSERLSKNRDPFVYDHIQTYKLQGHQVLFGQLAGSNAIGMKVIQQAAGSKSGRQIVIMTRQIVNQNDLLSRRELEKIMLSLLDQGGTSNGG